MKRWAFCSAAIIVSLAGCGGGDTGGTAPSDTIGSAPTPTSTPVPPSPPIAARSQPTILTLNTDTNLGGFAGSNGYSRARDGSVIFAEDYGTAATTPVQYQARTGTFNYTSFEYLITNERVSGSVSLNRDNQASTSAYAEYTGQNSGISYRFTQLTPGSANSLLPLYYSSIAIARASYVENNTGIIKYGVTPMAFGVQFDWVATKLTGLSLYSGIVIGHARGLGSHVYELNGTVEITLNYDTTAFTGRLRLTARDDLTGEAVDLGIFDFQPDPPRGSLDYFFASARNEGRLQAKLAGSLGEEFIGAFDAKLPDPRAPGATLKLALALAAKK